MKKNENLKQSSNPAEGRYSYDVVAIEAECDGLRHLLNVSEARLAKQTKKLKKAKKAARDTQEAFCGVSNQHDEAMAQLQEARQLLEEWANMTYADFVAYEAKHIEQTRAFLGLDNVETCHPPKPPERPLPSPNVFDIERIEKLEKVATQARWAIAYLIEPGLSHEARINGAFSELNPALVTLAEHEGK